MDTVVVNIKTGAPYDVYIGRPSKWGNLWGHKPSKYDTILVDSAETAVRMYEAWILSGIRRYPEQLEEIKRELKGKRLGCFCKPGPCHGDILARLADEPI